MAWHYIRLTGAATVMFAIIGFLVSPDEPRGVWLLVYSLGSAASLAVVVDSTKDIIVKSMRKG